MYRLGLEAILGFKKIGNRLFIDPTIPPEWDGFEICYQFGASVYLIKVANPHHVAHHVAGITLDGQPQADNPVVLVDDKSEHIIEVTLGNK
jgi:cyclic beta-1,2-glucan synthetase